MNTDTAKVPNQNPSKPETFIERKTPLLTNVLVAAGGITHDADLERVLARNNLEGTSYEVNLLELLESKNIENNDIYLMSGDTLHVPKLPSSLVVDIEKYKLFAGATFSPRSVPVKVYGYVNNPGLINLDSSRSLNINSAITAAGGYLIDSAYAPSKVILSRADNNGKLVNTIINPTSNDITLLPNDIIFVPEKSRPLIGKGFDYMMRLISPVNAFANSYNNWALMFDPTRYQVIGK
ncbi:MAG: hypothetical protein MZU84_03745 [Sphingobacterium sp.]|nr:hypothetical protein [Sphingobacterium sp.]